MLKEGSGLTGVATGAIIWAIFMPRAVCRKSHGGGIYIRVLFHLFQVHISLCWDSSLHLPSPLVVLVSSQGASISRGWLQPLHTPLLTAVVAWSHGRMSALPTDSPGSSEATQLPGLTLCWPPGRNGERVHLLVTSNTAEARL